jgi:hypothetical protein
MSETSLFSDKEYKAWVKELKDRIRKSKIKAAVRVNSVMLELYWSIGADIANKQEALGWGSGVIAQLSRDLRSEFPDASGFSETNLRYMKRFYELLLIAVSPSWYRRSSLGSLAAPCRSHQQPRITSGLDPLACHTLKVETFPAESGKGKRSKWQKRFYVTQTRPAPPKRRCSTLPRQPDMAHLLHLNIEAFHHIGLTVREHMSIPERNLNTLMTNTVGNGNWRKS